MSRARDGRIRPRYRRDPHLPFAVIAEVMPVWLRKDECPGCVAARAADRNGRWPVGWCGSDCLRRLQRTAGR